jgi:hypothetical protein
MEIRKPKTLEEFPKFEATALRRGPTAKEGYTHFELEDRFDCTIEIESTGPQWFWLLFGRNGYLCAGVQSHNKETNAAVLTFEATDEPDIVGHTLAYLSPYWQGFHVWMVLDPNWGWEKKQFLGADAIAQDFESKDTSIVEGREVKLWTKLTRVDVQRSPSRHSPSEEQTAIPSGVTRLIPSGWDHEHCEMCNSHIDAGMFGYCDPDERWMCEKCYERYVTRRDLAFVDEI